MSEKRILFQQAAFIENGKIHNATWNFGEPELDGVYVELRNYGSDYILEIVQITNGDVVIDRLECLSYRKAEYDHIRTAIQEFDKLVAQLHEPA